MKLIDTSTPSSSSSVTPFSQLDPTNMDGNVPGPGDDVFIYRFFSNQSINYGVITLKRFAEKTRSKSGRNAVVSTLLLSRQPILLVQVRKLIGFLGVLPQGTSFYSQHVIVHLPVNLVLCIV